MEDLEHKDDIEIVDLDPPDGRLRRSLHQAMLRLAQRRALQVRISPTFALLLCIVGLLVMPLIIQADVPPILKPAPLALSSGSLSSGSLRSFIIIDGGILDVAVDGKIAYINSNNGSISGAISARRASDGAILWQHSTPASASGSLVADGGQVYFTVLSSSSFGTVEANRASDGALLWFSQLPPFAGPSPLQAKDGLVYVNTAVDNGTVYALRASDGKVLWHFAHRNPSPLDTFLSVADGIVSIRTPDFMVHVLRASDGSEMLHYQGLADDWVPAIEGQIIYFQTPQNTLQARRLSDGGLLWETTPDYFDLRSWTVQNGVVVSTTGGVIKALRGVDGSLLWQRRINTIIAGPEIQGSNVLYFTLNKMVVSLSITDGSLLWQHAIPSFKFSLVVMDGVFFLGENEQSIWAWRTSDGALLWHYTSTAPILWQPRVVDGEIYLRKFDGTLDVLRVSDGRLLWQYATTLP